MDRLDPQLVLGAYSVGVFPMADDREATSVYWVEPRRRAVLPLADFRLSKSLRKTIAADRFRVTIDAAFADIVRLCAESVEGRPETWINRGIEQAFGTLHAMGFAHSIECWADDGNGDRLVGGLYGLALGRAFFGESMVSRATDASKVALAWLVARMKAGGFTLLDCQFQTNHLASLGAVEIDRADYCALLDAALSGVIGASAGSSVPGDIFAADRGAASVSTTVSGPLSGKDIVQLLVHTS